MNVIETGIEGLESAEVDVSSLPRGSNAAAGYLSIGFGSLKH